MENIWDYPETPLVLPCNRHGRVVTNGIEIVSSRNLLKMIQRGSAPLYFFPLDEIRQSHLRPSPTTYSCPIMGEVVYYNVVGPQFFITNGAWSYKNPFGDYAPLKNYAAFCGAMFDACTLDDELIASTMNIQSLPIPTTPDRIVRGSGWISSDIGGLERVSLSNDSEIK